MARFYVTTPIYYVNDAPHIGHAYTTVVADAVARWHRLLGDETFFLTGTDEHGLKVQRAAEANGVTPLEWADRTSERFRDAWKLLDISNDDFIRTSEPRHHTAVQQILQRVNDNGYITLGTYEGLYCVSCEAYYTVDELIDGELCPIHRRPVEHVKEENYFFQLSRFEQPLLDWYEAHPGFVRPETKRNEALGFIRGGLADFSISRSSITWGVPIPWDPAHVTYVWFDALVNYLTAVGYGRDDERFAAWWPGHHVIGKDILRFHCVYWPAMLLAAGLEPPTDVTVHGFLLVGGEKMSKTSLNQISPADLVEDFGVDGYRYHFLRDTPVGPDSDFSYERMVDRYNGDLANNFGNLLSRVATVVAQEVRRGRPRPPPRQPAVGGRRRRLRGDRDGVGRVRARPPRSTPRGASSARRTACSRTTSPGRWTPAPRSSAVLGDALEALRVVAVLASPALPTTCAEVWRRIGLDGSPHDQRLPAAAAVGRLPRRGAGHQGRPALPATGWLSAVVVRRTARRTAHRPAQDRTHRDGPRAGPTGANDRLTTTARSGDSTRVVPYGCVHTPSPAGGRVGAGDGRPQRAGCRPSRPPRRRRMGARVGSLSPDGCAHHGRPSPASRDRWLAGRFRRRPDRRGRRAPTGARRPAERRPARR